MTTNVNHIRNANFALGKESPRHWRIDLSRRQCEVHRFAASSDGPSGLSLVPKTTAPASLSQEVRCRPDSWYRVEAVVRCRLVPAGPTPGLTLVLRYRCEGEKKHTELHTAPLLDAPEPVVIRAYFHASEGCTLVEVGVELRNAVGVADILDVRLIRILEPDEMSHPLACEPPYFATEHIVESACICSDVPADRPLHEVLSLALGADRVSSLVASSSRTLKSPADALFLPDADPPAFLKSLASLFAFAEKKTVVVSLPAFAKLARGAIKMRRIEQPDDPIHAKVVYSNEFTRGFALHDCFAFAWPGRQPGSFAQNQFRNNAEFKSFCKKHKLETLLVSNCDKDATSDQPICLFRQFGRGRLFVVDIEPIESPASTLGEPVLAAHVILSMLGRSPSPAGQFSVPLRKETIFREMIREAANRWDHFYVHDDDVPTDEVTQQIVSIGREDEMYGLPAASKPVILVRSGLQAGDSSCVYGAWAWFRQLLLHSRHPTSYAAALASKFRLAWVPCVAPWEGGDGWAASGAAPVVPTELEFDGGSVAAVIDLARGCADRVHVAFARRSSAFRRAEEWLPRLARKLSAPDFPTLSTGSGAGPASRRPYSWRIVNMDTVVSVSPEHVSEPIHHSVLEQGGDAIRIELPNFESDSIAHSIHHSHLAVTTLEQTIGLLFGLIAVNRTPRPISLAGLGTIKPGDTLVLDHNNLVPDAQAAGMG